MTTQADAQKQVLAVWGSWPDRSTPATHQEKLAFFDHLENDHPAILDFQVGHGQDKWQTVQAWLSER